MGKSLAVMQEKFESAGELHSKTYQELVLDYATEWESVVSRILDKDIPETHKLHKTVQHYEEKVDKLRKQVADKEEKNGSASPGKTEKLNRNDDKLTKAWKEYDTAATRTANLLEEATTVGWRDLVPLVQGMIVFEQSRDKDERELWACLETLQEKLNEAVSKYDDPAPSPSAIKDVKEGPHEDEEEEDVDSTERADTHSESSDRDETQEESKAEETAAEAN